MKADLSSKLVVCIDDEHDILQMLECLFIAEGFNVFCSSDTDEVLRVVEGGNVGIVFTDLRMPDIGGMELCRQVKKASPTTVVHAVSAFVSAYSPHDFAAAGFDGYLTKPFDVDRLIEITRNVIG